MGTDLQDLYKSVSNWGRWGPDDERGTLNFVTPECVTRAAALVTAGRQVGCGQVDQTPSVLNTSPLLHYMIAGGDAHADGAGIAADFIGIAPHGPTTTHIDALCHMFYDGFMYNGRPASLVRSTGAEANAITTLSDGLTTRGILLDIPALRGRPFLEPDDVVHAADLDQAAAAAGVKPRPGDAVLVRVGRGPRRAAYGIGAERREDGALNLPGLGADCLTWLHRHGIALLGSDGGNDVLPSPMTRERLPIHVGGIVFMGLHLIDNLHIEPLTALCAELGRQEFLFTLAPLVIERATGSPVNPVAVF